MSAAVRHSLDPRLLAVGLAGGVLAGLLGVGGGLIMVPLLVLWLGRPQREAQTISIAAVIPIVAVALLVYGGAGEADYELGAALAAGAVVGSFAGASLLARLDERLLKGLFGAFLIVIAIVTALE